jgi:hypothetical protein
LPYNLPYNLLYNLPYNLLYGLPYNLPQPGAGSALVKGSDLVVKGSRRELPHADYFPAEGSGEVGPGADVRFGQAEQ